MAPDTWTGKVAIIILFRIRKSGQSSLPIPSLPPGRNEISESQNQRYSVHRRKGYLPSLIYRVIVIAEHTAKMTMISFQPVTETDLPLIKEIYDHYIIHSTATFHSEPLSIEEIQEIIQIDHPRYASYVIRESDKVIGYCFLSRYKNRQAYDRTAEVSLYFRPEHVGKGNGTIAMEFLEKVAKERGIHVLIGTVSGENLASIKLSEKMGFSKVAHLKNIGEKFGKTLDVVLYQKEI